MELITIINLLLLVTIVIVQNFVLHLSLPYYSLILCIYSFLVGYINSYLSKKYTKSTNLKHGVFNLLFIIIGIVLNNISLVVKEYIKSKSGNIGTSLFEIILFGIIIYFINNNKFTKVSGNYLFNKTNIKEDKYKKLDLYINSPYRKIRNINISY